jgi:hypothetical protein
MRTVAIALLSLMLIDFGIDLWQGEPMDSDSGAVSLARSLSTSTREISDSSNNRDVQHECVCCCAHVEHETPVTIQVALETSRSLIKTITAPPQPMRVPIFHPPQLFA